MKKRIILILIVALIFSCNSKKEATKIENQNINRIWMLVNFKNYSKESLIKKSAFLDLTNSENASAKMGCNNLSFAYKVKEDTISFSEGIATRMFCEDMSLENDFYKEISSINNYKIEGHKLLLTSSKGEKMEFIAQDWD